MISPSEIKDKALRWWNDKTFLGSIVNGESFFPRDIPRIGLVPFREKTTDYLRISEEQKHLKDESKESSGSGYSLEWEELNHQQIGRNKFIKRIFIESEADYLFLIGKKRELTSFRKNVALLLEIFPTLKNWASENPLVIIDNQGKWAEIILVCQYFLRDHEFDRFYIRELPIKVHTKFIETNKELIADLLDILLPPERIINEHKGTRNFERRYRLKYNQAQIRMRILDDSIAKEYFSGLNDFSLSENDFAALRLPVRNVVIMENKTNYSNILNFLSLPHLNETIAIFGSGFRVWLLKKALWLSKINIYYWGDIDAQGLQILGQLRGYQPDVKAILMDFEALNSFKDFWERGTETFAEKPANLSLEEEKLFLFVRENNIRLEQEKLSHEYVVSAFLRAMN